MSIDNALRTELRELAVAYTSGMASSEQFARLEDLLDISEEARSYYILSLGMHANLYWYHRQFDGEMDGPLDDIRWTRETQQKVNSLSLVSRCQAANLPLLVPVSRHLTVSRLLPPSSPRLLMARSITSPTVGRWPIYWQR